MRYVFEYVFIRNSNISMQGVFFRNEKANDLLQTKDAGSKIFLM